MQLQQSETSNDTKFFMQLQQSETSFLPISPLSDILSLHIVVPISCRMKYDTKQQWSKAVHKTEYGCFCFSLALCF